MSNVLSPTVSIIRAMKKSNDNVITTVANRSLALTAYRPRTKYVKID
jgi:hypothetical protein